MCEFCAWCKKIARLPQAVCKEEVFASTRHLFFYRKWRPGRCSPFQVEAGLPLHAWTRPRKVVMALVEWHGFAAMPPKLSPCG